MRKIEISVARTVQARQYEPLTVEVRETISIGDDEDADEARLELYKKITQMVKKGIDNELLKASKEERAEKRK
jgi:ribosomal protein S20